MDDTKLFAKIKKNQRTGFKNKNQESEHRNEIWHRKMCHFHNLTRNNRRNNGRNVFEMIFTEKYITNNFYFKYALEMFLLYKECIRSNFYNITLLKITFIIKLHKLFCNKNALEIILTKRM